MSFLIPFAIAVLAAFNLSSCAGISPQARTGAVPEIQFRTVLQNASRFQGETVTVGGYILETRNEPGETFIWVLQSPLKWNREPGARDASEGRFVVRHPGFLDPAVYREERKVTVTGIVSGLVEEKGGNCPVACLDLESREIRLWPERQAYFYRGYPYYPYDPFYDPFFYPYRRPYLHPRPYWGW